MFKKISQCSVIVLMAIVIAACHQNDRHWRDNGNGNVNCYHHNGNVNCHRN
jgi:hypothetical protein